MKLHATSMLIATVGVLLIGASVWAQNTDTDTSSSEPRYGQEGKDVVWVPTADSLVARMLDMAEATPDDVLVDLGSGDGRTVIAAARRGVPARGIEYNPELVEVSRRAAEKAGVTDLARFEEGDIFESDFSEATVVTLFLLPALNLRLRPILLDMKPGTRVVSNSFDMGEWQPDDQVEAEQSACQTWCRAYKWVVPAKVDGRWRMDGGELVLRQTFQMLEGTLRSEGRAVELSEARMHGARIRFSADGRDYVGKVSGDTMRGTIDGDTPWSATR
ncbi:SAM-dependent methyltransferase [Pseudazoarcus pumilus]|uniref:SAM-dependent methyltransferase n=1 Tax=Pseudazoarcus pumilus TaxID=2067960 RepID=A0A2I6S2Y1_9RHOO|nr:methyltransferase domain-containing protein [Pseudazoarcus pumilus]AUN93626.1 SAM-dependent methyltransferase [Pseudazoarcus pumilus]